MIPGQAQQFFEAAAAQSGGGDDSFKVERSLRFNSADTSYLNRTVSSSTNRRTWTWSGWIKRSVIADRQEIFAAGNDGTDFFFDANDKLNFYYYQPGVGYQGWCLTDSVFRDPSAWYHIVLIFDSTQSTTADRVKIYVNNTLQSLTYNNNFTQYEEADINLGSTGHYLGRYSASNNELANFYLAETQFIDGQALTPSSFGELDENNNWNPKEFSGSYNPKQLSNWVAQTTGTTYNASVAKANAFDGRTNTAAAATSGGTLTFTPSSAITGITKVRIYAQRDNSASSATITLNGTDISSNWSNGDDKQVEITATTLTSLAWTTQGNGQWFSVRQIEIYYDDSYKTLLLGGINSFYLKFADNSSNAALGTDSSGNDNTWTVNNLVAAVETANTSQTWSSNQTGYFSSNAASAFDGNLGTSAFASSGANANAYVDITAINASKVEVYISAYGSGSAGAYYYCRQTDGTQHTYTISSSGTSLGWITVYDGSQISINRLGGARNSAGAAGSAQYGWKVDGVLLVNSGTAGFDPTGIDSLIDTPTNYTAASGNNGGNYSTMNPLLALRLATISNGNLDVTGGSSTDNGWGTIAVPSGKWYAEVTVTAGGGSTDVMVGVKDIDQQGSTDFGAVSRGYGYSSSGQKVNSDSLSSYGASYTNGDVIGIALDLDAGTITFYKNGSSQGAAFSGISSSYSYHFCCFCRTTSDSVAWNFGQRPFAYTPPSNHLAVCTKNLSDPSIADGSTAFDIATYTGNATTDTAITGLNNSPDLLWIKSRSSTQWHFLADTVRGNTKNLASNATDAEETRTNRLLSFDSNGFTIGNSNTVNENNSNFVAWAWDAGTSTASNTDGSITSSVRASQTNGCSVVSYTGNSTSGATVGHGLNAKPEMIIVKSRTANESWFVNYPFGTGTGYLMLQSTDGADSPNSSVWNSTDPTSSVFTLGNSSGVNGGQDYIAYCFAPVEGFSKFDTYTGNNSTDGPYVYTGFRPAWVMVKGTGTSTTFSWVIVDSARSTINPTDHALFPNSSENENDLPGFGARSFYIDLLSNGFKIRIDPQSINTDGQEYIYAAFAEHPFKTARAR